MKNPDEKVLYMDCFSGISGDMFIGALLDSGLDEKNFTKEIYKILPPEGKIKIKKEKRNHFEGTKFDVEITKKDIKDRHLKDIKKLLENSKLNENIVEKSEKMFEELAEVEAEIHGTTKDKIHFHELGAIDSIADIAGAVIFLGVYIVQKIRIKKKAVRLA